jgi:hypothetical protein
MDTQMDLQKDTEMAKKHQVTHFSRMGIFQKLLRSLLLKMEMALRLKLRLFSKIVTDCRYQLHIFLRMGMESKFQHLHSLRNFHRLTKLRITQILEHGMIKIKNQIVKPNASIVYIGWHQGNGLITQND